MPIRQALFLHHMHVRHADFRQDALHTFQACTIQRRIDHTQGCFRFHGHGLRFHRRHKAIQGILTNVADHPRGKALVKVHSTNAVQGIDGRDFCADGFRHLQGNLATVLPVNLVAVVLGRVMAGRNANTGTAP